MPTSPSARKRHRQSLVRRAKNRAEKSTLKTQLRKVRELATAGDTERGATEMSQLAKKLDRAAAKQVIHPNMAARLKSRASKRLKAAKKPAATV